MCSEQNVAVPKLCKLVHAFWRCEQSKLVAFFSTLFHHTNKQQVLHFLLRYVRCSL